jgi:ComF family protein
MKTRTMLRFSVFEDALHLLYPHTCNGCGSDLLFKNQLLCVYCLKKLPHTRFAYHENNLIEKIFRGRIPVKAAHSEFYFSKGRLVQHLVHQLKYNGNKALGEYMGEIMGETLLQSNRFPQIDLIIPLPMFADKEFKRGYNQATVICHGLGRAMQVNVSSGAVTRNRITETQTRKHRAERWQNVDGSFSVSDMAALSAKNILLVDDVLTTGASLEACGSAILRVPSITLSIATLAYASK